jgi:hypothetical protein
MSQLDDSPTVFAARSLELSIQSLIGQCRGVTDVRPTLGRTVICGISGEVIRKLYKNRKSEK